MEPTADLVPVTAPEGPATPLLHDVTMTDGRVFTGCSRFELTRVVDGERLLRFVSVGDNVVAEVREHDMATIVPPLSQDELAPLPV